MSFSTAVIATVSDNFCGKFDLRNYQNEQLVTLIKFEDLSNNRSSNRIQCGFPGESLPICSSCSNAVTEEMMTHLRPIVGEKSHIAWHAGWHKLRGSKNLSQDFFQQGKEKEFIPASMSYEDFLKLHVVQGELSGEDFLYMHRLMLKMVQLELSSANLPCIAPWEDLPASIYDKDWPLAKKIVSDEYAKKQQEDLDHYLLQLKRMRSEKFLKSISLNKLGQIIEPALHQNLHNFYRGSTTCSPEAKAQGYCDDLLPVETSPLNKHFWKIHGLVDGLVGSWLKANDYQEIATDCQGHDKCYEWKGTWIGKYPSK
jgi:hypothetical protein